jgi:UDP-N-acetylglucosamine 2-epimerase
MKILSVIGARPQFIKAAAVSRALGTCPGLQDILVHTGQHYDENMSDIFFRQLRIPEPDYNLEVGSGSHAVQTGLMLKGVEEILLKEKPDCTLVYGDTNSTLAGALASAKLHIPVAHVEAGLRSFNRIMPEEINRIVTDRISDILFAPTLTAVRNLRNEGLENNTVLSGDVMLDSVLFYKDMVMAERESYQTTGLPQQYLLATIHRAENTDNKENLKNIFSAFATLSLPVILPVHPRTARLLKSDIGIPPNVMIIDPVGYLQMILLTLDAAKVLTDSGGLQKEAYFLGKQCITIRTETEWVETLHDNWNIVTGTDPVKISEAVHALKPQAPRQDNFGNGSSAKIIVSELNRLAAR